MVHVPGDQSLPVTITVQYGIDGTLWPGVLALRHRVFEMEQGIIDADPADSDDRYSIHAIATVDTGLEQRVVAAGRITLQNQGRSEAIVAWLATEPGHRRRGIGGEIMRALLDEADRAGMQETVLAAQRHAETFYASLGFLPSGAPYKVRGIAHRWMIRRHPW